MRFTFTKKKYFKGDPILWGVIVILAMCSLLAIYSSTGALAYKYQNGNTYYYMLKHSVFLIVGGGLMWGIHRLDYKLFAKVAPLLLGISILLLLITLVVGSNLNHASRWLVIPGIGVSFQPSELAKLAIVAFIARTLARNQDEKDAAAAFKPIIIALFVVCALIMKENLSTAALVFGIGFIMMFIGRVPAKRLFQLVLAGIGIVVFILIVGPQIPFLHRAKTWRARVERFFNDDSKEVEGNYQSEQAEMAVATGGFTGKGPGNSIQRNFLPHSGSDFIFAIIVEEFGALGAIVIMLTYLIFLYRVGVIVRGSSRTFPALLAMGLSYLLVFQGLINMGVAVGILPVTGQTLPLISMGGSSVLFTCVAFGVILSVSRNNMEEADELKESND